MLLEPILAVLFGFIGLVWSADRFINGAAAVARIMGMSAILIGLTIVAFGTSAPEIVVSISASLTNAGDMAVGNALGSNLANIGLVLGITILIAPIPLSAKILYKEIPALLLITAVAGVCLYDNNISRLDGILLISLLLIMFAITLKNQSLSPTDVDIVEEETEPPESELIAHLNLKSAWLWLIVGLILLLVSANILVWGAKEIAFSLGVSQLVVGLTVVAVGTSLPELAASVASAIKGHHDIALGNIIGSNILNILSVMSVPGLIAPTALDAEVFSRDYVAVLLLTVMLAGWIILITKWVTRHTDDYDGNLGRFAGFTFLFCYVLYYVVLFLENRPSDM